MFNSNDFANMVFTSLAVIFVAGFAAGALLVWIF